MLIRNLTRLSIPARNARFASGFSERLTGLIGKSFSDSMDGMVFDRCNAIHTFFMRFPIDVIFADECGKVLRTVQNFPPWRPFLYCKNAFYVIELPSGRIESSGTRENDVLDMTGVLSGETEKQWMSEEKMLRTSRENVLPVKTKD